MAKRDVGYVVINTFFYNKKRIHCYTESYIALAQKRWKSNQTLLGILTIEKSCYMSTNPTTASLLWSQN